MMTAVAQRILVVGSDRCSLSNRSLCVLSAQAVGKRSLLIDVVDQ